MMNIKKGEIVELEISGYAYEGKGIAKVLLDDNSENKYVIFVNGAYPGDKVKARIVKKKKSFAEARTEEVLVKSTNRINPRCKYFGVCGGCKQQDLDYSIQLKYKAEQVIENFERIGGLKDFQKLEIVPSEKQYYYRNKMEFSFADKRWLTKDELKLDEEILNRNFALGLHIPRIYDKVLDLEECFLQSELSTKVLNATREYFQMKETSIYSTKTHQGYLRNLVIKTSHHTNDFMVNLVTSEDDEDLFGEYAGFLVDKFPEISTIINNVNTRKAQVAIGEYEKRYFGSGFINDTIGNYKFRISGNSFFQTNTLQAENLYQTALDFAEFNGDELVYDLYSGAGTITLFMSKHVKHIIGFESVEPAIKDAKVNAELNEVENAEFFITDLNKSLLPVLEKEFIAKPDVIIADPPRAGMNPKTVNDILTLNPKKIVYISCNPSTQARDIKALVDSGKYKLVKIKSVDMFPQTFHIENVALLIAI